jgi:hypothetical protein
MMLTSYGTQLWSCDCDKALLAPEEARSLRQVVGDRCFLTNSTATGNLSEIPGGPGSGATDRAWTGACDPRSQWEWPHPEDRSGEQRQFGQTVAHFGRKDEGTMGTNHLLGSEGQLFDGPVVAVQSQHMTSGQRQIGHHQQWLGEAGIVEGHDREEWRVGCRFSRSAFENQVVPDVGRMVTPSSSQLSLRSDTVA